MGTLAAVGYLIGLSVLAFLVMFGVPFAMMAWGLR